MDATNYSIPLINFSKCGLLVPKDDVTKDDLTNSGNELYAALSSAGFAYLTDHGIDWSAVDELNEVAERFYSLPQEIKNRFALESFVMSYDAVGKTKSNLKQVDYFEGFRTLGQAYNDEAFPWPHVPDFKETYIRFAGIAGKLLLRILRALGYGMKLKDPLYFCKAHSLINQTGNWTGLKTLKYSPISEEDSETENRIGEHSDKDCLTLLFQDNIGGLQVRDTTGKFINVPPIPGAIVINIGDTMAAWSGNRLKATRHRVIPPSDINNRDKVRRSVGYFGQADNHVLMKKLVFEDDVINDPQDDDDEYPLTVDEYNRRSLGPMYAWNYDKN